MTDRVNDNRAAMQQLATDSQQAALRALKNFVGAREETYGIFNRLDPTSQQTEDARLLLERAKSEYQAFAEQMGDATNDENPDET